MQQLWPTCELAVLMAQSSNTKGSGHFLERCLALQRVRKAIGEHFGYGLCSDPVWDMLLELYLAHEKGYALSLSSLALASNVPPTTALRAIRGMESHMLVERIPDHRDGRRYYVTLLPDTLKRLEKMFEATEYIFQYS